MDPSSTVRRVSNQRATHRENAAPDDVRAYRRQRQHLYPLQDCREALATGGTVRSFCGIEATLLRGGTDAEEAVEPGAEDCVTCVDIWRGRRLARL